MSGIIQTIKVIEEIDKKKEERLRPRKEVNHMNTRTTKQTMKFQEIMQKQLEAITRKIVVDRNLTIDKLREKYKNEVGSIIANGIRESYLLGLHFIEGFAERTTELSVEHVNEMNGIIQDSIDKFWNGIDNGIKKFEEEKKSKVIGAAVFDGDLFTRLTAFLAGGTTAMNFFALNQGTVTTYRQIFSKDILDGAITVSGNVAIPKLIWITERDDRVCPICRPLDGQTWFIDEPNIPRPNQDTHIGCRCRLLPLQKGKVFNA